MEREWAAYSQHPLMVSLVVSFVRSYCSAWLVQWSLTVVDVFLLFSALQEEGHSEWVSCVRFSPNNQNPIIVSCGWDRLVKVREKKFQQTGEERKTT